MRLRSSSQGIVNSGNTCYAAAMLQVLAHAVPFVVRLAIEQRRTNTVTHTVTHSLFELFSRMWNLNRERGVGVSEILSTKVLSHVGRLYPHFDVRAQNDAHEFLLLLLDALDTEAKKTRPSSSWVDRTVSGTLESVVKCGLCRAITRGPTEAFVTLHVSPLSATLQACVDAASQEDGRVEDWRCDACTRMSNRTRRSTKLGKYPRVLIVVLQRFDINGQKTQAHIETSRNLRVHDLTYDLVGIVCHQGFHARSGHYVAVVPSTTPSSHAAWKVIDDECVREVRGNDDGAPPPWVSEQAYMWAFEKRDAM